MQPPDSPLPPQPRQGEKYAIPVPVFVGAVLVLMLMFICGLGAVGAIPSIRGLRSPTGTAKPTLQQTPVTSATLGGTLSDFTQRYGNSIDASGQMYATTLAGQRVLIVVQVDNPHQSSDGQLRVIAIDVQVPGDALDIESWDAATADSIARTFLPADAHEQDTLPLSDGTMTHLYTSEALAAAFAQSAAAAPGTLSYTCHAWPPSASGYGQCLIASGVHPN